MSLTKARPSSRPDPREVAVVELISKRIPLSVDTLTRYGLYALLIVVLAAIVGYGVSAMGSEVYAARSEVLYEIDTEQPTGFLREDRGLTTQQVMIQSRAVLAPVAEANDLTVEELADKLHVSTVDNSEVLRIEVHDSSSAEAETLTGAIADEYIEQVRPSEPTEAERFLEGRLEDLDDRRRRLVDELAPASGSPLSTPEQTALEAELDAVLAETGAVQAQLQEAIVASLGAPRVEQITEPYALADPVAPRPRQTAIAGALAGVVVAAVAVAVLVRRQLSQPSRP